MMYPMDDIERAAVDEFGRRRGLGQAAAVAQWVGVTATVRAECRAAVRATLRMDRAGQDRMMRSTDLNNRSA
jgi:hypothetical protein